MQPEEPKLIQDTDPDVLRYYRAGEGQAAPQKPMFPLGLMSASLGVAAMFGIPAVDALLKVPGYVQSPILMIGFVTAILAIGTGAGALFLPTERFRAVVGLMLGTAASVFLPVFARL